MIRGDQELRNDILLESVTFIDQKLPPNPCHPGHVIYDKRSIRGFINKKLAVLQPKI
jgi:hypothetical protein